MPLSEKIEAKDAVVGVIGLGYVGLPLARAFHDAGFRTLGFDVDPRKIELLNRGGTYLKHLGADFVEVMAQSGRFEATADFARLAEADAILICVPTPLGPHLEPDLSYVERTTDDIAAALRPGQLIVLESTTYPTTTRDVVLPRLEATGHVCGRDFYVAFSPEREDPGRKDFSTRTIPKLVGGIDEESGRLAVQLYTTAFEKVIGVRTAEIAEAAKLMENIYRAVNIALVNELKMLFDAMGIDVWEVIEAASTKPFGFQAFYPGPGLGGHCIPIDPFYLTWKAREVNLPTRFIELAGEINRGMPDYVVHRCIMALNDRGKAIRGARVLVLGVAYKPDIDDLRESPSFELIEKLQELGADVVYNDPHVPQIPRTRRHDLALSSVDFTAESLREYDLVLLATNHSAYDYALIAEHAPLVIDTRGALRKIGARGGHIIGA